jgi:hypothetical protein
MTEPTSETTIDGRRRRSRAVVVVTVLVIMGLAAYLVVGRSDPSGTSAIRSSGSQPTATGSGPMAPNGTFTTPSGATSTIASLRGKPTMVWFVAAGCASCAASIPAVAQHLAQLRSDGVQVLTLGLYGAFPAGKGGVVQLLSFGQAAADTSVTRPGWTWGMASKALSVAYDPSGTPDLYALIGPDGRIGYQNSVPVSTMPQLLTAAGRLTGHPVATGQPSGHTRTTGDTLP